MTSFPRDILLAYERVDPSSKSTMEAYFEKHAKCTRTFSLDCLFGTFFVEEKTADKIDIITVSQNPESALSHRQTSLKNFLTAQSPQAPCIQYGSVEFRKRINNYIRFNERFIGKLKKLPLLNVSKTVLASKLQLVYCCVLICDTNLHFKCSCAVVSGSFRLVFIVKVKFYKITIKQSADYYSD